MARADCAKCGERFPIATSYGRKRRHSAQMVMVELFNDSGFDHGESVREQLPPALDVCGYCSPRAPETDYHALPPSARTSCYRCGGPRTSRDVVICDDCSNAMSGKEWVK